MSTIWQTSAIGSYGRGGVAGRILDPSQGIRSGRLIDNDIRWKDYRIQTKQQQSWMGVDLLDHSVLLTPITPNGRVISDLLLWTNPLAA